MSPLQNLSIRVKLMLVSLIPILGLLYYLQENVRKELSSKYAAQQLITDVTLMEKLSAVIHELQKERAMQVVFAILKKEQSRDGISSQREVTDRTVSALNKFLQENNRHVINLALLDSLSLFRSKADAGKFSDEDNQNFIVRKNLMLNEVHKMLRASPGTRIKNNIEDHITLIYTKDLLGQIRRHLTRAILEGKFDELKYGEFSVVKGMYEMNLDRIEKVATPELQTYFQKQFQGPLVEHTHAMIDSAFADPGLRNIKYDYETWYPNVTACLNLFKGIEDFSSDLIRTKAEQEVTFANQNVIRSLAIGFGVVFFIVFIVFYTIRGIVGSVAKIKNAAGLMASGKVDIFLEVKSRDEIGDLAVAFGQMIKSTKEFSTIAESIGKGDYSPLIGIRSDDDVLGKALETMKNNLQKLSLENQTRNWLLSGNAELNDKIKGEKDLRILAQDVVTQLSTYLKAQIAAIYLKENGQLDLVGSYAFHHRKGNSSTFKLGQGLVGQAALEKKMIIFSDVPQDYIKINSGLGNAAPQNIIVFPFLYEEEVKGVIEIGMAHQFSELDMQFLNMAGNNIAIAFNTSQSRTKLKELLEETQRQAEELEVQQEELKQSNEELVEKTGLLENSETELKAQQEELQQTNEELEEKANILEEQKGKLEMTKMEIESKARELESISKYKSEFLANMSHELRTPLNSILILSQLLSENKNNVLKEKETEFAKNIYSSGADLLNLINEILDLSKVESGKMELDIAEVAFGDIVADIISMFSEVAKARSIDFNAVTDEKAIQTPTIITDKLRLEQILRNLLANAFKFTEKGGQVKLLIGRPASDVSFRNVNLVRAQDVIFFTVKDTGIGIPFEKQGIIFEAFQQADGSTKRKYGGTGLGLSICRELASALGGEIYLESQEGEGSSFTLYLPLRFESSKIIPEKKKPLEKQPRKVPDFDGPDKLSITDQEIMDDRNDVSENDKVVLIIEDEAVFAKLLLGFVRERHYKGVIAQQGNTGLSYARHYKPDAIILDMKLPVMDGPEVLRQLKSDPALRHIPVQIISGHDLKKEGMELGAFDYVRKPVSREGFQSAFDKLEEFVNRKLKKLLIVEDNALQNKAIRELIGNGDVKCFSSYSGMEAYEMMKKENFDCTIVDLGLPDMSGFELLEKIKGNDALNKIPTIVYTGKDLTKEETNRLNKLANTVVLKTADSHERLLDETSLFLHRVESRLPKEKQTIIRKLHKTDEVLKDKLVLVVDDDIRNIYSLTNVLKEEGMNCLVAENGNAALQTLKDNPSVDIVLMDIMMPEMDGYDATREIRKLKKLAKLPVIALTAKAMKGDREKCLAAGMSDYISKPVNIEQLLSLMRVWLYR